MTTGRINQVTVLRARHPPEREKPHEAAGTGARALSPARVKSPTDQSRSLRRAGAAGHTTLSGSRSLQTHAQSS